MPAQQFKFVQHFLFYQRAYQRGFKVFQLEWWQLPQEVINCVHMRKPQPEDFQIAAFKLFTPVVIKSITGCFFKQEHRKSSGNQFGYLVIFSFALVGQRRHLLKKLRAFAFDGLVQQPDDLYPALRGGHFWWMFKSVLTLKMTAAQ